MGQFSGVASDDGLMRFVVILGGRNLVEDGDHEDCSLAHAGLSLAQDVVPLESQGDGFDLHLTGMLEPALPDGPLELILEEKLIPTSQVIFISKDQQETLSLLQLDSDIYKFKSYFKKEIRNFLTTNGLSTKIHIS